MYERYASPAISNNIWPNYLPGITDSVLGMASLRAEIRGVHADSIGSPMAGFLLIWLIGWMILPFGYSVYTAARGAGRNGKIQEQNVASGVK